MARERWLNNRRAELLPCGYFHMVFTLPHDLNPLILQNKRQMLGILFSAVKETLAAFSLDPQWRLEGTLGFIAILHTWSQTLIDHFHLHCLIPAGALSQDRKRWIPSRKKFLFRTDSLAREFEKRYLTKMDSLYHQGKLEFSGAINDLADPKAFSLLIKTTGAKKWVVYAKRPFSGPEQILNYLGRYTHRVAIANHRIKFIDNGKVTFVYKDRSRGNRSRKMTLDALEFIRRFLLHVLPTGFMKIRYFGFLANTCKKKMVPLIRRILGSASDLPERLCESVREMMLRLTGTDICLCPYCGKGRMIQVAMVPPAYDTS